MRLPNIIEEKRTLIIKTLLYAGAIAFFLCVLFAYYRKLYSETRQNIINKGELNAVETASEINLRMASSKDTIILASYTIDNMLRTHRSKSEILDYMTNETAAVGASLITNTTGIYGYIDGEYLDGSGWVPDEGYDPTIRPWYTGAKEGDGDIVLIDPYVDMDTGKVMIALTRVLSDGVSVAGIDLSMDDIQRIMERQVEDGHAYADFIVSSKGVVIAHSNRDMIGKDINEGRDALTKAIVEYLDDHGSDYSYIYHDGKDYMLYFMQLDNDWTCVSVIDATDDFEKLRTPLVTTSFLAVIIIAIFMVILMFSEKKDRMARELAIKTERAMAASEAKTAFLSNMSHEIRTPVNAILGMNEMILRESDDDTVIEYSSNIKRAGSSLLGIINDVLDFSKVEAGKIEIIPVDYDISSVINDLVNMIHTRADEKGLELKLNIGSDIPRMLNGDEVRIKQIITNILTNAVKYTEKGGIEFNVGCEDVQDKPDHIKLNVSVKDTGIGIRKEDIDKIFTQFERVEEKRNRNIEGTGLGMSITRSLLDLMGSSLEVESTYGEGSVFSFSLEQKVVDRTPMGDYKDVFNSVSDKRQKYREKFTAPSAHVLVVDDNPMNLVVFKNLVKNTLIKVDTADGGDEGIAYTQSNEYDLIFLDHMMPVKDGVETLHEIREQEDNPNKKTVTVCLTANAISGAREQYTSAGFDDYLTKPIDHEKLEDMLYKYLPKEKVRTISADERADQDESSELNKEEIYGILEPLKDQSEIDIDEGVGNSGSLDSYISMLRIFRESYNEKAGELERFHEEGDIQNYTIKVHALKSSAKIIGANDFGESAQSLEDAGKREDTAFIDAHHMAFMEEYGKIKKLLDRCRLNDEDDDTEKPEADEEKMQSVLVNLREAAVDMDCDRIEAVIDIMKAYAIPDEYKTLWEKLCLVADQFDYEGIVALLDNKSE